MQNENTELARRLTQAILDGDVDTIDSLYDDEFTAWRNFDSRTLNRKQSLKLAKILPSLKDFSYDDVRVQPMPSGYVQQHILHCTGPAGEPVEVYTCLVATVRNGKFVHIDEYMDSKQVAPLLGG